MDGVIVDSMPYHFIAWYEALRAYGVRVSCFDVYEREGERWQKTLQDLLKGAQVNPTPKIMRKIFSLRQRVFKKYFRQYIFPGAKELLACLARQGYLLALVTGTPIAEIRRILPKQIFRRFNCIISGDKVKHGKPHPEPYLKAAEALGLKPAECVVVENAPLGIRSAKSAGIFTIAITTSLPAYYLLQADTIVNSLEEITGKIDKSCRA